MKKVKGVYTIEAAVLIPLVLSIMAAAIGLGIELYTEVASEASVYSSVLSIDEVKTVHKLRAAGNLWREISENGISQESE